MKKFTFTIAFLFSFLAFSQQPDFPANLSNGDFIYEINDNELDTLVLSILSEINPDSIEQTMLDLQNFGTRFMLAPNRREVANWIQNKFLSLGINNTAIDSFQTHTIYMVNNIPYDTTTWQYNVIATLSGKHNPENVYITSGHYDCFTNDDPMNVAPGADDDASGVAAVIEIARIFMEKEFEPNSTIKFAAFAAEELMNFSSYSGASYYASTALANNENIVFYINNDMISNSEATTDWKFNINNHDPGGWATLLGLYVCGKYTSLTAYNIDQGEFGADDLPFYLAGYTALFMFEDEFSPHYHSNTDLVENCNMDYCAEITKVTASMLIHASETPLDVSNYYISNPGDGSSLVPVWRANTETDIAGYHVYLGTQPGIYDTILTTTDTTLLLSELNTEVTYFIGVSAYNYNGYESPIFEKSDSPVEVSMENGILIICDSEGGFLDPTNEEIIQFYDSVCVNFQHTQLDANTMDKVSLGTIGKYSSVLWHINNYDWDSPSLRNSTDALRNYLNLGGHVLITIYKPGKMIENTSSYPTTFTEGSFMFDYANVANSENAINKWFYGAYPATEDYDSIYVDSVRIAGFNYCIPYIEAMSPTPNGEAIYFYDTNFDTTSTQGSYYGKTVGIENSGTNKNVVILSFPLYYTNYSQAKALVNNVMHNKFGETYLGIEPKPLTSANSINIFPNPAENEFSFLFNPSQTEILLINIFSMDGKLIKSSSVKRFSNEEHLIQVDISELDKGMYVLQVISGNKVFANKILKL